MGIRAIMGDRKLAVDLGSSGKRKSRGRERERGKLRDRLWKWADGYWINVGYWNTLINMGFC